MKLESNYSFSDTLGRLRVALEVRGFRIFATIDQRAEARSVGLELAPTVVLIYGNPMAYAPLMLAGPDFALELPLRLLVREEEFGKISVTYNPVANLEGKHGLPMGMTEALSLAEQIIASAVTAAPRLAKVTPHLRLIRT